jgi:hypothetical protein
MSHEDQRLSSYLDNELDDVTAGIVKRRLEDDSAAAARYGQFAALREALSVPVDGEEEVRNRVFYRLERHVPRHPTVWQRRVDVPLPALTAAAALLVVVGVLALRGLFVPGTSPQVAETAPPHEVGVTISVEQLDIQEMLDWLNNRDMLDQVTIELPASPTFRLQGEPALIRASEAGRIPRRSDGNG